MEKPINIKFGSGPTRKFPLWDISKIDTSSIGVSHRGKIGLNRIKKLQTLIRDVLEIPNTHKIAFVSGGATSAFEFLLWNLLSDNNEIDIFSSGVFGNLWNYDIVNELKLKNSNNISSEFGEAPNFLLHKNEKDAVFVFTETTTGVSVENLDWINDNRNGLTICDATSAVFCTNIDWHKLDATAFSLQKGIGGEGGLGIVILNDRAIKRINSTKPNWPMPRLFRIPKINNEIDKGFFDCCTINTISLLTVEDMILSLEWAKNIGGLGKLIEIVEDNYNITKQLVENNEWLKFLVQNEKYRAKNVACIEILDKEFNSINDWNFLKKISSFLEQSEVALDILNHSKSKPCLRIWLGPAVQKNDIKSLFDWIKIAYLNETE